VLAEGRADTEGRYRLSLEGVSSKTHEYAYLIARMDGTAIAWKQINLDDANAELSLDLPPQELIKGKLVDIEGQPAAGVELQIQEVMERSDGNMRSEGVGYRQARTPEAWPKSISTDEQGRFEVHGISRGHGVLLGLAGSDRFASQEIALNSGMPEQRGERDGTYRPLVKNVLVGEEAVLPLAPAQLFEGAIVYDDTGQPAPNARLTIWASQQEPAGSMTSVAGMADSKGHYQISPKPGILFGVIAYPPDGVPYLARQTRFDNAIRWQTGDTLRQVNVSLPRGVLVRGKVVELGSNVPVAGATIQYVPQEASNPNAADDILTGWQGIQLSGDRGDFEIAVLPGPGWLLVHGPQGKYVLQEIASRQLQGSKPGGRRYYSHAIHKVIPDRDDREMDVTISLRSGATVTGRIVDEQGEPVDEALVITRLVVYPYSLEWRGQMSPTWGGKFELSGLEEGNEYPVYFLNAKRRLGATAHLRAGSGMTTVVIKPCGEAQIRFVDPEGQPHAEMRPGLRMVVTPGAFGLDFDAMNRGELAADEDFVANINRTNYYWDGPKTDKDGIVTLLELIPGATYRLWSLEKGEHKVLRQFSVESGEHLDLGEFTIERTN
jgi:hypothetical protein